MGENGGIERHLDHGQAKGQHGKMKDPSCGYHPFRRNVQLRVQYPQPYRFRQQDHDHGDDHVDVERHGEHFAQQTGVPFHHVEIQEPLRRHGHGTVHESEQRHGARHDIVNPVILHAEGLQDHPRRVKGHEHDHEHPCVQEHRVFCNSRLVYDLCHVLNY